MIQKNCEKAQDVVLHVRVLGCVGGDCGEADESYAQLDQRGDQVEPHTCSPEAWMGSSLRVSSPLMDCKEGESTCIN